MNAAERFAPVLAEIAEGAVARERDRELPWEAVRSLRESGFTALRLPVSLGGGGASLTEFFDVLVELARADSNLPQLLRGHIAFVEHVLASPEGEWRSRWLARLADGEILGNAQSEPGGSAFWRPNTRITRGGDGWQVDGRKYYSTGSLFADWIYTSGADGEDFVSAIVRGDGEGVERIDDWDGFGQRLTGSGTTVFTGARADADDVTVHRGGERPPSIDAAVFQLVLLATLAGIGQRALDDALELVRGRSRSAFTASIAVPAQDPQVHQVLGEVAGLVHAARASVAAAARTVEDVLAVGPCPSADEVARAELAVFTAQGVVVDLVLRATTDIFRVGGASATAEHRALDRHWRNARTVSSHNPEIFRAATVGRALLDGTTPHDQLAAAVAAQITQGVPA